MEQPTKQPHKFFWKYAWLLVITGWILILTKGPLEILGIILLLGGTGILIKKHTSKHPK
jgi:hypothetical protein